MTLTFDLYDRKTLYKLYLEKKFCTIASRIIKLDRWMHHWKVMCGIPKLASRIFKLGMWMHHGKAIYHVPN